jgi:type IV pilus assembly protein PilB
MLSPDQVSALQPGDEDPTVWSAVVRQGWISDLDVVLLLAREFKLKVADLTKIEQRASVLIPESLARKHRLVPISADERMIRVASADPRDHSAEQAVGFVTGRDVELLIASPAQILEKIDEVYRPERSIERLLQRLDPGKVEAFVEDSVVEMKDPGLEAPVARLVDALVSEAVREGASDIHAEPDETGTIVRFRVDGVLKEVMRLPQTAGAALVRRAKILSRLDVTDPLHPHDGRAAMRIDGKAIDLRVSTVPIARRGEKVVVRILDQSKLRARLSDLGLTPHELNLFNRLLGHREGMLLVTGPTGSGKTTTLYAALNQLKTGKVNIVTVEDPVEYDVAGITQIQVSEAQGLTFANVLRSVLRQDPDILLVGEIRDAETAQIAIQAGLSGHFVLSTLHTNDSASAIVRLRDMGLDSFKIASVLRGVVAQRLVRKLCEECAVDVPADSLPANAQPPRDWAGLVRIRKAVGCKKCLGIGYKGRTNVLEILPVDENVARLIDAGQPPDTVAAAARRIGMMTLWESGLERAWQGVTTIEELVRVLGERVQEDGSTVPNRASVTIVPGDVRAAVAAVDEPMKVVPGGAAGAASRPRPAPPPPPAQASHTPQATHPASPTPAAAPERSGETILLADDDPQMRRLVRGVLERDGYKVLEAGDGLDALDMLSQHPIALVVLDMDMPRLDGLGVLEELRANVSTSAVPVIMLTARSDETEGRALDLGAQDYLIKPIRPTALSARVRAVLRRVKTA